MQISGYIPGYDGAPPESDMLDDTPPMGVITSFKVVSEFMPALSAKEKRTIRKNFVYVRRIHDLGRSDQQRRVRDEVEFDEASGKWRVIRLAKAGQSDILRNPQEWEAFYNGASSQDIGTPLSLFFPNDPSRVEWYAFYHIRTVERLANLNDQDVQNLGNGVKEDRARAQHYLNKTKGESASTELAYKLEQAEARAKSLEAQVQEMNAKLTELLKEKIANGEYGEEESEPQRRGRGRPSTKSVD